MIIPEIFTRLRIKMSFKSSKIALNEQGEGRGGGGDYKTRNVLILNSQYFVFYRQFAVI